MSERLRKTVWRQHILICNPHKLGAPAYSPHAKGPQCLLLSWAFFFFFFFLASLSGKNKTTITNQYDPGIHTALGEENKVIKRRKKKKYTIKNSVLLRLLRMWNKTENSETEFFRDLI